MKIRDIINAATPGPWVVYEEGAIGGVVSGLAVSEPNSDHEKQSYRKMIAGGEWHEGYFADQDAEFVAMANPKHFSLIEDILDAVRHSVLSLKTDGEVIDELISMVLELDAIRKEQGYE